MPSDPYAGAQMHDFYMQKLNKARSTYEAVCQQRDQAEAEYRGLAKQARDAYEEYLTARRGLHFGKANIDTDEGENDEENDES